MLHVSTFAARVRVRRPARRGRRRRRQRPTRPTRARRTRRARRSPRSTAPPRRDRIDRGVAQVLRYWRPADGDPAALVAFVQAEFLPRGETLDRTFGRFEFALERLDGYLTSLDTRPAPGHATSTSGRCCPLDERLAAWNAGAHVSDDLFANKLAFVALLNFPLTTLEERLAQGGSAGRAGSGPRRASPAASRRACRRTSTRRSTEAYSAADSYIAGYNVFMHHVLTERRRSACSRAGMRLISHWNLRDELKARYSDPGRPAAAAADPAGDGAGSSASRSRRRSSTTRCVDWTPATGRGRASRRSKDAEARPDAAREPRARARDRRAVPPLDRASSTPSARSTPHTPDNPDPDRPPLRRRPRDPRGRRCKALLEAVLDSPLSARVARARRGAARPPARAVRRLVRRLQAARQVLGGRARCRSRASAIPTPQAYAADIPRLLRELGFSEERARFVAAAHRGRPVARRRPRVRRGTARRPGSPAHARRQGRHGLQGLQHRRPRDGPQRRAGVLAEHDRPHAAAGRAEHRLHRGDRVRLPEARPRAAGARRPRSAGREPARARRLLGRRARSPASRSSTWPRGTGCTSTRTPHPRSSARPWSRSPATSGTRHFAALLGGDDVAMLAVYSHMIDAGLYLPDYPLGHLIAFQVEEHFAHAVGADGCRVRAHLPARLDHARRLDAQGRRSPALGAAAAGCDGAGAPGSGRAALTSAGGPWLSGCRTRSPRRSSWGSRR